MVTSYRHIEDHNGVVLHWSFVRPLNLHSHSPTTQKQNIGKLRQAYVQSHSYSSQSIDADDDFDTF